MKTSKTLAQTQRAVRALNRASRNIVNETMTQLQRVQQRLGFAKALGSAQATPQQKLQLLRGYQLMTDGTSLNTVTSAGQTYLASDYAAMQTQLNGTGKTLDKDAFLQLLVTQMRYQDPLDPQDNSEYVAQLAQFSALEQMTNVAKQAEGISKLVSNIDTSVLVGQLSSMIGQDIQWTQSVAAVDANGHAIVDKDGKPVTTTQNYEGKVTGVSVTDGAPSVIASLNGRSVSVSIGDIIRVGKYAEQQL